MRSMKTISHSPRTIVAIAGIAALAGLATASGSARLPHAKHLEEGLECSGCHTRGEDGLRQAPPKAEQCSDCHDELPGADLSVRPRRLPVPFSHAKHEDLDCADCHGDLAQEGALPKMPAQADCARCHAENGVKTSCKACHGKTRFRPTTHDKGWERRHGKWQGINANDQHGGRCADCHTDAGCTACHQKTRPRSHTGFWRTRGHGLRAEGNRDRCATCHVEASCIRCHRDTPPVNHRGLWTAKHGLAVPGGKSGDIGNCRVCHDPGWCAACHAGQ